MVDQGFIKAKPIDSKLKEKLKMAIKEFIKKNYRLPIVKKTLG
jgi:hypothetical protein